LKEYGQLPQQGLFDLGQGMRRRENQAGTTRKSAQSIKIRHIRKDSQGWPRTQRICEFHRLPENPVRVTELKTQTSKGEFHFFEDDLSLFQAEHASRNESTGNYIF
jgi:hypothetical protein